MQRFRTKTPSQSRTVSPSRSGRQRTSSFSHQEPRHVSNKEKQPMAAPCAKLYLGDLSYHCSEEEIYHEFAKKGYNAKINISLDKEGKTRGYGFAEFETNELATQARDDLQGMNLHGRRIRINYAGHLIQDQTPINTLSSPINSVYIRFRSNLDITFDEAYLESFFVSYGTIIDVCIKDIYKVRGY